jgi:CRISPR/Cas system CMR-associated protein Cmr5 small subunit
VTAVRTYVAQLRQRQKALSSRFGSYLESWPTETRVALTCSNGSTGVLAKLLVDKGYITDAELIAALDAALTETFTPEKTAPEIPPDPAFS